MAIYDGLTILCGAISSAGAITGQACNGAGNVISTNTMDLGSLAIGGNQISAVGQGKSITVDFHVRTAPTVGTTCKYQLIQADDAALTSGVQVLASTDDIPIANLPIGRHVYLSVPAVSHFLPKRYVGARIVNVGVIATHTVFACLVQDGQSQLDQTIFRTGFAIT